MYMLLFFASYVLNVWLHFICSSNLFTYTKTVFMFLIFQVGHEEL